MKSKLTLILPSLNVAGYIEECMESVLRLTLPEIEFLCVDAGSTDGTLELLCDYEKKDARVRILHSGKKSYGYQVNMGIREAKGDYVAVVETDDRIVSGMMERMLLEIDGTGADFVKGDYYQYKTDPEGISFYRTMQTLTGECESFYGQCIDVPTHPELQAQCSYIWNGLYRRDFLLQKRVVLNETPGAAFQDISFYHRLILSAEKAIYLHTPVYYYRTDREGASTRESKGLQYAMQEYRTFFETIGLFEDEMQLRYINRKAAVNSFMFETAKLLRMVPEQRETLFAGESYTWFRNHFLEAEKSGTLKQEDFSGEEWSSLRLLLEEPSRYAEECSRKVRSREKQIRFCDEERRERVIFGCGNYGMMCRDLLFSHDIRICAYTDNNEALWGCAIDLTPVVSPAQCVKRFPDAQYIIANKRNANEIKEQLEALGLQEDQIVRFRG